jgi:AcrR family transcriptional regulator
MPLVVDKDKVRLDILMAFERCMADTPMTNVSLRDIAKEAGMSHANLLNYFASKDDLIVSYVRYTRDFIADKCREWFATHSRKRYKSNLTYMNAFMSYVAKGPANENRPIAPTQTYVLAHYNPEIRALIAEQFEAWHEVMEESLVKVYGEKVGKKEAEVMIILIAGTFICNYNRALTGVANNNILGTFANLIND